MTMLTAGLVFTQTPAKAASVCDELKQPENDWTAAAKAKDASKLGALKTIDQAKALADLKVPGNSLDSIDMGEMTVRVFGNTAIVTGSDVEKSKEAGKDTSGKYVWTDVFVKQANGKWQAVSSQSTKVAK